MAFDASFTDHFDQLVQEKLRKDLPIVTTKHAEEELRKEELGFTAIVGRRLCICMREEVLTIGQRVR